MNEQHWRGHINKKSKQDKSNPNKCIKDNPHTNIKTKEKIDHFIVGPGTESDREAREETTLKMHDEFSDVWTLLCMAVLTFLWYLTWVV